MADTLETRTLLAATPITFDGRTKAVYTDADGGSITVSLKGPGSGTIQFDNDAPADAAVVTLSGTTGASSLSVKGDTRFGTLVVNGGLKSLTSKTLDLAGDVTVTGGLPKIQVRSAFNSKIAIGQTAPVSLTLGNATDVSLSVSGDVKSIKVDAWADNDGRPDKITAANVQSVTTKGDFGAGITAGTIAKMNVGGAIVGAAIRGTVGVGTVTAAALRYSLIYAGIRLNSDDLPTSTADFANGVASIKSLTLKNKLPGTFTGSRIAAPSIGKLSLGPIGTFNSFIPCGVAADRVDAFSASTNVRGPFSLPRQEPPTLAVNEDDFVLRVL